MGTEKQAVTSGLLGLAVSGLALLLLSALAGTFNYWQAWVFVGVIAVCNTVVVIAWAVTNPVALQRRGRSGPVAETRTAQKYIIMILWLAVVAMVIFSAIDHRFGWSRVPSAVSLIGDALVAIGIGINMLVVIQNNHAASTVRVEAGQEVVSRGV